MNKRTPRRFSDVTNEQGVYYILNMVNNLIYVGQTKDIQFRMRTHLTELRSSRHHNKALLQDWHHYGSDAFEFGTLVTCAQHSERQRIELLFIRAYRSFDPYFGYNSLAIFERDRQYHRI